MSNCLYNAPIFFVTGTDTDVGKSWVTVALLRILRAQGLRVGAVKPLVSGCPGGDPATNADITLLSAAQPERHLDSLCLHAFEPPIAPHIAAEEAGQPLSADQLARWCRQQARGLDLLLVEGVGGWRVPLNETESLCHWAAAMDASVLLVVGMKLGCINHALLSAEAILADGLPLTGWLANWLDRQMNRAEENLASLQARMPAPLLAQAPWCTDASQLELQGLDVNQWPGKALS